MVRGVLEGRLYPSRRSLPRVYIAAVAASRESSTGSSYTTPTASYFRGTFSSVWIPDHRTRRFSPPFLCLCLALSHSISHSYTPIHTHTHIHAHSLSLSLPARSPSHAHPSSLFLTHPPVSLSLFLSQSQSISFLLVPSIHSLLLTLPPSLTLSFPPSLRVYPVAPLALSAHTPRLCPPHLFLDRCLSLPRVAYVCL